MNFIVWRGWNGGPFQQEESERAKTMESSTLAIEVAHLRFISFKFFESGRRDGESLTPTFLCKPNNPLESRSNSFHSQVQFD